MTRNLPWCNELQPEPFVEMSEELADDKGISNGDMVTVSCARGGGGPGTHVIWLLIDDPGAYGI